METGYYFWALFIFTNLFAVYFTNGTEIDIQQKHTDILDRILRPEKYVDRNIKLRQKEKEILDQILSSEKYDARIRPSGVNGTENGPVLVYINTFIRDMSKIDDVNMEYSVQLTFRQQWKDERLKFDDLGGKIKYLSLNTAYQLWTPDLFFSNEKESHFHNMITPNNYVRIFKDGEILYSMRISLTLFCSMNLINYPMDIQICSMRIPSYGFTTDDIVILWKEGDSIQIRKGLTHSNFKMVKLMTDYCNSKTMTGEYSCAKVDFMLKRIFSYYFVHMYLPSYMLVLASWVSFWIDPRAVTARVLLGLISLITLSAHISSMYEKIPPTSYTKAIDVWFGVCLAFVFAALLEFATVHYISQSDTQNKHQKDKRENRKQPEQDTSSDLLETCESQMLQQKGTNRFRTWISNFLKRSKKIDVISRIIFPLAFVLFNLGYWYSYLLSEQ